MNTVRPAKEHFLTAGINHRRYWSLYFWTMLFSNLGILICATEQVMNATMPGLNQMLIIVLASVGWPLMVTGQSLVLYSRLHMLFIKKRALRLVLCMIIFNALAIHSTGISLSIGLQFRRQQLLKPYRLDITILSGLLPAISTQIRLVFRVSTGASW